MQKEIVSSFKSFAWDATSGLALRINETCKSRRGAAEGGGSARYETVQVAQAELGK